MACRLDLFPAERTSIIATMRSSLVCRMTTVRCARAAKVPAIVRWTAGFGTAADGQIGDLLGGRLTVLGQLRNQVRPEDQVAPRRMFAVHEEEFQVEIGVGIAVSGHGPRHDLDHLLAG